MLNYANYMSRCIELARFGQYEVAPNPMVGAVLVYTDGDAEKIIGEGWHQRYGEAHAEVNCFANVRAEDEDKVAQSTLFVSLEPCSHYGKTPPCADLIIRKGVKHVVVGMLDPNPKVGGQGVQRLRDAGIEVKVGVLEAECRELNKRFLCLQEKHRPYVILKWAQTADGFIDHIRTARGEGHVGGALVISTPFSKMLVHRMRAQNMAIMVGTNTAVLDNPSLKTTHWIGRSPIRVVVDRNHRIPADSKIFLGDVQTIVYDTHTDWQFIVDDLASRGIHSILVEGGAQYINHIIQTGIWDEAQIEQSPLRIGDGIPAPSLGLQ